MCHFVFSGERLFDHIKRRAADLNLDNVQYSSVTFEREIDQDSGNFDEVNSDSSESSYSDLILNYTSKRSTTVQSKSNENLKETLTDELDSQKSCSELTDNDQNSSFSDIFLKTSSSTGDLVNKSKKLITSVSDTLLEQKCKEEIVVKPSHSQNIVNSKAVKRQCSEMSFTEESSIVRYIAPLEEVVKWASQILLALEKLHLCGIVVTYVKIYFI